MDIREAVGMWGEQNNIEVTRMDDRLVNGKQIYLFGNLQFYIAQNVTFVKDENGQWNPQSLQELLTLHNTIHIHEDLD